jgi:hypothetical protein
MQAKRMVSFFDAVSDGAEHFLHQFGVRPAGECGSLGLLHLRRSHQLHRLGNLAGVLDRLDAAADVSG